MAGVDASIEIEIHVEIDVEIHVEIDVEIHVEIDVEIDVYGRLGKSLSVGKEYRLTLNELQNFKSVALKDFGILTQFSILETCSLF